jgi:uncharacterized protein YbbC (DUF1343 family)/CubicO group peptidase (beta-lactamase class C family)
MVRRPLKSLVFATLILMTPILNAREIDRTCFARADESINSAIERGEIPGAVLLAGTDREIVYLKAYGNRAVEPEKLPMKTDTIFDLASLSKSIGCATSIMALIDQGKIDLHDRVSKYIPEFAANGKQDITVEQLLLHQSGMMPDNPMKDYEDGVEQSWKNLFKLAPTTQPGTKFVYSDVNFEVLGELVHRVSGQTLDQFAREHVFEPLGMRDTMYNPPSDLRERCAYCEKRAGHWMIGQVHDPRAFALGGVAGHAGVFSTAEDVAKWCQMLLNGGELNGHRILKDETVREMTTMRSLPDGTGKRGYGLDFDTPYSSTVRGDRFARAKTFGHTGYTGTSYWIDPVNKCFVVLLTNRVHPSDAKGKVSRVRREVATAVAEAFLGPLGEPASAGGAAFVAGAADPPAKAGSPIVLCGIDVLERDHFRQLDDRRIALITNQTGLTVDGRRTVDLLAGAKNCKLVKIFSPEHGLFGKVDEKVGNTVEEKTGLPVLSLYGKTTRPTDEMLEGVDTLVYDIQDVGARFYTYESTLGICMQEAAKHKLKFVVLDRPNPVTGTLVDGPLAEKEHFGFTAFNAEPVAHGMTIGELAQLFNDAYDIHCDLTVVQMQGWRRSMWFDETNLVWVNPSPNMRNLTQALLYTGVCLLEATNVSVGRGTDQPFEQFGAPWIDHQKLAANLNDAQLPGLRFVPIEFTPIKGAKLGEQLCRGVYIIVTDRNACHPVEAGVTIAWTLHTLFGEKFEAKKVENLLANKDGMNAILSADDPSKIPLVWQEPLQQFKRLREKYLIYH